MRNKWEERVTIGSRLQPWLQIWGFDFFFFKDLCGNLTYQILTSLKCPLQSICQIHYFSKLLKGNVIKEKIWHLISILTWESRCQLTPRQLTSWLELIQVLSFTSWLEMLNILLGSIVNHINYFTILVAKKKKPSHGVSWPHSNVLSVAIVHADTGKFTII